MMKGWLDHTIIIPSNTRSVTRLCAGAARPVLPSTILKGVSEMFFFSVDKTNM